MKLISRFIVKPFEPAVEKLYREFFFQDSLPVIRATLIVSVLFFVLAGLVDTLLSETPDILVAAIRYGVVVPALLIGYFLSYKGFFADFWDKLLLAVVLVNATSVLAMVALVPDNHIHYAELMFVFVSGYYFLRLSSRLAILLMWLFMALFIGVITSYSGMSLGYILFYGLLFVVANLTVMAAAVNYHSQNRKIFILSRDNKNNCPVVDIPTVSTNFTIVSHGACEIDERPDQHNSDQCPLMVFEVGLDGKILYANKKAMNCAGISPQNISGGVQFAGLFLPEERAKVFDYLKGGAADSGQPAKSFTLVDYERVLYFVNLFSTPILKENNIVGWRIILVDISGQMKAEQALRELDERYNLLVDNLFDGIFLYRENALEYASNRLCMILGYEKYELLDKSFDLSKLLIHESILAVKEIITTKLKHTRTPQRVELSVLTKSGAIRAVEVVFVNFSEDRTGQLFGVVRDITELRIAEKLSEEAVLTGQSAIFKKQFMSNISHEIRTQVTGIVGIIEVLSGTLRNVKHTEYIKILESSTDNLIGAINQILAFSDKEAGNAGRRSVIPSDQKIFSNRNIDNSIEAMRSLRILIVEDKQINQKVIELILTSMGHRVALAGNGVQALELFIPGAFDLILMDIKMPIMDGVAATMELKRKYQELPPIVGLSASPLNDKMESYVKIGMDDYLTKPLRKDDFVRLIKKLGL